SECQNLRSVVRRLTELAEMMAGDLRVHVAVDKQDIVVGFVSERDETFAGFLGRAAVAAYHADKPSCAESSCRGARVANRFSQPHDATGQFFHVRARVPVEAREWEDFRKGELELSPRHVVSVDTVRRLQTVEPTIGKLGRYGERE